MDCNCRILDAGEGDSIGFCSLHKAAPQLLAALRYIRNAARTKTGDRSEWPAYKLDELIAIAEGRDAR